VSESLYAIQINFLHYKDCFSLHCFSLLTVRIKLERIKERKRNIIINLIDLLIYINKIHKRKCWLRLKNTKTTAIIWNKFNLFRSDGQVKA